MTKKFNIWLEAFYSSRKGLEGYVDSEKLIGRRLWFHTNITRRDNNWNGMIGIYGVNSKGNRMGSPLSYTNDVWLKGPIVFEAPKARAEKIVESGKKTLIAGVSGVVEKGEHDVSSWEEIAYTPYVGHFFRVKDQEKRPIFGAENIYFHAKEDGKYVLLAKNIK
jgi:hypothetical protein